MGKRNLHSLMSGILNSEESIPQQSTGQAVANEAKKQVETQSKQGPGRPRTKSENNDDTRATFIVSAELLRKIKYIAFMDERLQSDVVGEALSNYVLMWEKENGSIKLPRK